IRTAPPAPGTQLGRYQLTELQGQGGFAWVYHGRRDDGKSFAVKVLKHRYGSDPAFETRFRQEASLAAGLRHPNIVHIEGVGAEVKMVRDGPLPRQPHRPKPARAGDGGIGCVPSASGIADALGFAHDQDIVHRDIKPGNILFAEDGRPVLTISAWRER